MTVEVPVGSLEAVAGATVVLAITGSVIGMSLESMSVGFIGALVARTFVTDAPDPALTRLQLYLRSLLQLLGAALLAGMMTPLIEAVVHGMAPIKLPAAAVHLAVPGVLGMIAPVVIPVMRKIFERIGGKQ